MQQLSPPKIEFYKLCTSTKKKISFDEKNINVCNSITPLDDTIWNYGIVD